MDPSPEDPTITQPGLLESAKAGCGPSLPTETAAGEFLNAPLTRGAASERFQIIRRLGEGGMAVVYEAIDRKLGEKRALKFSKSGHARSIPPEARAALKVTHENVCRAFEIHTAQTKDGATDFISMEYVEGETLAKRWRREPLSQAEALEIARQLCRGVMAAHEAKVLHLDLKSSNVMLGRSANGGLRVIVMDFGLAQAFSDGAGTSASQFGGTPNYIAPERYMGAEPTPQSDIYALGVILYEMLTGQLPYPKDTDLQTKLYKAPATPSEAGGRAVDPRWDPIILRCLESNPVKRMATAAELLAALDTAFTPSTRRFWLAGAAASTLLGAGLYAFRERLWGPPPLARLAVLPLTGTTGDKTLDARLQGGLSEVSNRLESLGAASRRLVLIRPEEAARHLVDTAEMAGGKLGATHVLLASMKGTPVAILAEVRSVVTGEALRNYAGEFAAGDAAAISTSLAGLVTAAFQLGKALPAKVNPEAYPFYAFGLGLLEKDRISYDRALAQFETAAELDPVSPLILAGQAMAWLQKFRATKDGRWLKEAAKAVASAERLHPDSPPVLQVLGEIEREEGRPEKAIDYYNRAVALEPNRSSAWRFMGLALNSMGKDREAVAALRKAIELAPGYYVPHQALGSVHFQKGRLTEALRELKIVTELVPGQPEGHASYGGTLLAAEREAEAEQALRRSLELRETRPALNNLGVLLRYQGRNAEAVEVFSRAVRTGVESAGLRINLGNALKHTGRASEARTHFAVAAELARTLLIRNPRDAQARAQLAYAQVETGRRVEGLDNAMQAARLDPNNYSVLFLVTMTMELLGKRELAAPLLRGATAQQLGDLRRQPDLRAFVNDSKYKQLFEPQTQK